MAVAKKAIGDKHLCVDANSAYSGKQALALAAAEADVRWFEEPVSSDDLEGLRYVRQHGPDRIEVVAEEYGYDLDYFRRGLPKLDLPNLWVCDGSIFPTTGGVNPSPTITSIALRTADRIAQLAKPGEL